MSKKLPIRLRSANEEDIPFIFNSWLKSYRNSYFAKSITNTVFYTEHHKLIEKIIEDNTLIIACKEDSPEDIYGFICAGKTDGIFTLHYVYVKHSFRGFGIGKTLLNAFDHDPAFAGIYSHHTKTAERLAPKFNMIYHPYVIINDFGESDNEKA